MGHNSFSGGGGQSSRGSHLDFVSYWADKTVEEAVLQGQQLRMQKAHSLPSREYDVVDIDFIKPPCSARNSIRRRKKAPKVSPKRHRSRSPSKIVAAKTSPRKEQKQQTSKHSKLSCGMRIAELAVPTKRHCLETWKTMYNTLPDYMIERLRQHIMDQRPVVEISDAIHCFKRKCKRHKKTEKSSKMAERSKKIKYPLQKNEVKVLGAIFGHRIAKKLTVPFNIILNSDLEKMAGVISCDIGALMRKSIKYKNIDTKNKIYQMIESDVVKKVTIWVSDVLDESIENILEDQLKEFEAEAGPALDCIDDLMDNVLDICIPITETLSTSGSDESGSEKGIVDTPITSEHFDEEHAENIEDHFKNELVALINNIASDKQANIDDYQDVDDGPDWQSSGRIVEIDSEKKNDDVEPGEGNALEETDVEQDSNIEQEANEDVNIDETDAVEELRENTETDDTDLNNDNLETNNEIDVIELHRGDTVAENIVANKNDSENNLLGEDPDERNDEKEDEYLESDDVAPTEISPAAEIPLENNDEAETFADATGEDKVKDDLPLSEDTDRKVKFGESVSSDQKQDDNLNWKDSIEQMDFAEPNEGLLSDADESWPDDVQPPLLRPSQSAVKSITSLGRIQEDDERPPKPEGDDDDKHDESERQEAVKMLASETDTQLKPADDNEKQEAVETLAPEIDNQIKPANEDETQETVETLASQIDNQINSENENERQEAVKTLPSDLENQIKAADNSEKADKTSTMDEFINSKQETGSKASGKKDKTSISNRFSNSKKSRSPSKTLSQRSPSKTSKILSSLSPTRSAPKTPKKIIYKDVKSKKDTESTRSSRSTKDIEMDVTTKDNILPKVKPKADYRVNLNTAPDWLNRNYTQPSCSCVHIASKTKASVKPKVNENLVRKWYRDLEQGYENLKMWNKWIENTARTVCMLKKEIDSIADKSYCPERCSNTEWMKLKRDIDKDAQLWTKLNQNTHERLQGYKKMYKKRSVTPSNYFICCSLDK